jgi:hypothetical protein
LQTLLSIPFTIQPSTKTPTELRQLSEKALPYIKTDVTIIEDRHNKYTYQHKIKTGKASGSSTMKYTTFLALAGSTAVVAQDNNCVQEKGNWYCSEVQAISYSNFGVEGQYQKVTKMGVGGECDFAAQSYGGGMAPFDGEVSSAAWRCA